MKKFLLALVVSGTTLSASAQGSGFGLGIMVGEPTGFSWKYWTGGDRALAGGVAWGLSNNGYFHLHADYLFHKMDLIPVTKGKLPLYFGPGVRMRFWGNNGNDRYDDDRDLDLSVRFPVGLAYLFDGAPVDVFLEAVPTMSIIPSTDFDFDAALGVRYWF